MSHTPISGYADIQLEAKSKQAVLTIQIQGLLQFYPDPFPWESLDPRWRTSVVSPVFKL